MSYTQHKDRYSYSGNSMELIEKFKNITIKKLDDERVFNALIKKDNETALKKAEALELKKEAEKIEKQMKHLYNDRLNEIISVEEYISYNKNFNEKLRNIREKICQIEKDIETKAEPDKNVMKDAIREFLEKKCIDRKIIDNLVDRIEFGEKNPKTGKPMLKIFWAWD